VSKSKKPAPRVKRLPDSRLRTERLPAWLDQRVVSKRYLAAGCRTYADLLALWDDLSELMHTLSICQEHPIIDGTMRRCRVCHCTQDDCSGCVALTGDACTWSPEDPSVCTACVIPKLTKGAK
jgi:hypothetical protein